MVRSQPQTKALQAARSFSELVFWTTVFLGLSAALVTTALALPIDIPITNEYDDGNEMDRRIWDPHPTTLHLGRYEDDLIHNMGLRFIAPELISTNELLYARLRFGARGSNLSSDLTYQVTGVLETMSPPLSDQRRPSQLPRTTRSVTTVITEPWHDLGLRPLFYYTEDISSVINEVISQTGWGYELPALIFCIDDVSEAGDIPNYVTCSDLTEFFWPVTLQVCRTLAETFTCHESLSRPTNHSVTVNFVSLIGLEAFVQYGRGTYTDSTVPITVPAQTPGEIELTGLFSNTEYIYRLFYRAADSEDDFETGSGHTFRTQRPVDSSFTFTTQADSHIWEAIEHADSEDDSLKIYRTTLQNIVDDQPDFHFSLGDFSLTEYCATWQDAWDRYEVQRQYLGNVLHSVPFYLVIGNHEGELGWKKDDPDSVVVWAERARRALFPNPFPDDFYSGCPEPPHTGDGFRESYYAWEWGDALFVVLDPYWYTEEKPYHNENPEFDGGWTWTLGQQQYDWLYQVLNESEKTWKIVLLHHLLGGVIVGDAAYGRGGIEVAKWSVNHRPSFEWGGENEIGLNIFSQMRPGWSHGPIHDLLVDAGVQLVIHGHDHFCGMQQHDGIFYALCPQPMDPQYGYGGLFDGAYINGDLLPNTGHMRYEVTPNGLTIEYVRSFLPGEGPNGWIEYSYTIPLPATEVTATTWSLPELRISPNPASGPTTLSLYNSGGRLDTSVQQACVYDIAGRLCARLSPQDNGSFVWHQRDLTGRPVPSGVYYCAIHYTGGLATNRLVVVR